MAVISRRPAGLTIPRTVSVAVGLFIVAFAALLAVGDDSNGSRLTPPQAEAAALAAPEVRTALAGGFTRVRTMPLDERTMRVSFLDGPRGVAEAAIGPDGRVRAVIVHDQQHARLGSDVGQSPPILAGLVVLFLVATLRLPLMRRRNVDAVVLAAVTVPIVLLNEAYYEWSAMAGGVLLTYLGWRLLGVAVGRSDPREQGGRWVMETLSPRVTGVMFAGATVALVLLSIPGGLVSDIGFASLAGATEIVDGRLPYGNLVTDGLIHGDTYPLLAYLAYLPAALVDPVRNGFDTLDGALFVATAFALVAALALVRAAGRRVAIAFLAFPPVMVAASSGSNDVVAAAFVAAGLAYAARAGASSAAVAVAGWVKLGPLALVPLWMARYRGGGAVRAVAGVVVVTAVLIVGLVVLGGPGAFADMAKALSFQFERESPMSPWALLDLPAAQIAFQAAVVTGMVLAVLRVWRDPVLAADPRRMAALGAAVLLGVQLAANHWSVAYLAWVFPLVAVALLGDPKPSRLRAPAS